MSDALVIARNQNQDSDDRIKLERNNIDFVFDTKAVFSSLVRNAKSKVVFSMAVLFSWIPPLLITLVFVSFIDFVAGMLASKARGREFHEDKARRGIAIKILLILFSISGYVIHDSLPLVIKGNIPIQANLGSFLCGWIIYTEFLSILKNVKRAGYSFPEPIEKVLVITETDEEKPTSEMQVPKNNKNSDI